MGNDINNQGETAKYLDRPKQELDPTNPVLREELDFIERDGTKSSILQKPDLSEPIPQQNHLFFKHRTCQRK